jgi:hypothetical protein
VDVTLVRGELRVAVEISITTPVEHELGNVEKCLAAGFSHVLVVSVERRTLAKIEAEAKKRCEPNALGRIAFLAPDEIPAYLDALPVTETTQTVGGYKVRVRHSVPDSSETSARLDAVRETIARSLKKFRRG